jgi:hypothetical protein
MTLITRQGKGSRLTIQEMDGNLEYLEQLAEPVYTKNAAGNIIFPPAEFSLVTSEEIIASIEIPAGFLQGVFYPEIPSFRFVYFIDNLESSENVEPIVRIYVNSTDQLDGNETLAFQETNFFNPGQTGEQQFGYPLALDYSLSSPYSNNNFFELRNDLIISFDNNYEAVSRENFDFSKKQYLIATVESENEVKIKPQSLVVLRPAP